MESDRVFQTGQPSLDPRLADDIELPEIAKKALGIISQIKDVQADTEDLFEHPLRELLG